MITFDDLTDFMDQEKSIIDNYNEMFEEQAENSKFQRNRWVHRKYQKDIERRRAIALSIYNKIFTKKLKEKNVSIGAVKSDSEENCIKKFFRQLFGIKPKEIPGVIEEPEQKKSPQEEKEHIEIESSATVINPEENDIEDEVFDEEDLGGVEYSEEELDKLYPDDRIEGQMDVEDLNNGDVYEK